MANLAAYPTSLPISALVQLDAQEHPGPQSMPIVVVCVSFWIMSAGSTQQHWPFPSGSAEETGYAYILTHPGIPCIMWEHYFDHGFGGCIKHLVEVRYVTM